jgi:hypothetical protein
MRHGSADTRTFIDSRGAGANPSALATSSRDRPFNVAQQRTSRGDEVPSTPRKAAPVRPVIASSMLASAALREMAAAVSQMFRPRRPFSQQLRQAAWVGDKDRDLAAALLPRHQSPFGQLSNRSRRYRLIHPGAAGQFGNRGRRLVSPRDQELLGYQCMALLQWHGVSMAHYLFTESAGGHPKSRPCDLDDAVKVDETQLGLSQRRAPLNRDRSSDQDKAPRRPGVPGRQDKIIYGRVAHRIKHLDVHADAVVVRQHVLAATADGQVAKTIGLAWDPRRIQAKRCCHKLQTSSLES